MGRQEGNSIILNDDGISRFHVRVDYSGGPECTLTDVGSSNGTYLGDRKLTREDGSIQIADGQVFHIGDVAVTFAAPKQAPPRKTSWLQKIPGRKKSTDAGPPPPPKAPPPAALPRTGSAGSRPSMAGAPGGGSSGAAMAMYKNPKASRKSLIPGGRKKSSLADTGDSSASPRGSDLNNTLDSVSESTTRSTSATAAAADEAPPIDQKPLTKADQKLLGMIQQYRAALPPVAAAPLSAAEADAAMERSCGIPIRVAVRKRPLNKKEVSNKKAGSCIDVATCTSAGTGATQSLMVHEPKTKLDMSISMVRQSNPHPRANTLTLDIPTFKAPVRPLASPLYFSLSISLSPPPLSLSNSSPSSPPPTPSLSLSLSPGQSVFQLRRGGWARAHGSAGTAASAAPGPGQPRSRLVKRGREGERGRGREGERERGREGGRERGREGEGERGREGERREGGREGAAWSTFSTFPLSLVNL
jgi:hypothetical protein